MQSLIRNDQITIRVASGAGEDSAHRLPRRPSGARARRSACSAARRHGSRRCPRSPRAPLRWVRSGRSPRPSGSARRPGWCALCAGGGAARRAHGAAGSRGRWRGACGGRARACSSRSACGPHARGRRPRPPPQAGCVLGLSWPCMLPARPRCRPTLARPRHRGGLPWL